MKKSISFIFIAFLLFANVVHASVNGTFKGYDIVKVFSGDQELTAANPAILFEGTTMVPIRMLEQLGFTVEWDGENYSVNVIPPDPVIVEVPTPIERAQKTEPKQIQTTEPTNEQTSQKANEQPVSDSTPVEVDPIVEETIDEPVEETEPDNSAVCQAIQDEYGGKIAMLSYQGLSLGKYSLAKYQLELERDQKLAENGCS